MSNNKLLNLIPYIALSLYDDIYYTKSHKTITKQNQSRPLTNKQRQLLIKHKPLRVFTINGIQIEAYSRKDAIIRYKHLKK